MRKRRAWTQRTRRRPGGSERCGPSKLTKKDEGGRLTQIGFTPTFANPPVYLMFCSVLWCKGGEIVNDDLNKITIASSGHRCHEVPEGPNGRPGRLQGCRRVHNGPDTGRELDPFTIGAVATMMNGPWVFTTYDKVAPDLDYGVFPARVRGLSDILQLRWRRLLVHLQAGKKEDMGWKFIETVMEDEFLVPLPDEFNLLPGTKSAA